MSKQTKQAQVFVSENTISATPLWREMLFIGCLSLECINKKRYSVKV